MNRAFLSDLAVASTCRCALLPALLGGSTDDRGSRFECNGRNQPQTHHAHAHGTVLVLDDDASVRRSLELWLHAQGFIARAFATAAELLESLQADGPACLLLDLVLGDRDGFDVLAELRRRKLGLPVIVLTGHGQASNAVRAMRLGAFDFLTKPHDPEELRAAIHLAMDLSAKRHPTMEVELLRQRVATLSARERAILSLVLRGMLNKQVAHELGLALVTVKLHRGRAMRKLGLKTPAELGTVAHLIGLGSGPEGRR